ncbi:MAG: YceD family protein [Pontixanthobacter sp.]
MTDAVTPEMSRMVKLRALRNDPYDIAADAGERAALARRFDLVRIDALSASVQLSPDAGVDGGGAIDAAGAIDAEWVQHCAVSGEELPMTVREPFAIRFVPAGRTYAPDEEVELTPDELDEIEYDGDGVDLGEAVAQSFGLAIDPYATGADADEARERQGIAAEGQQDGPLAELLNALNP